VFSKIGVRIGVLMGGLSAEREVSLKSGRAITAALLRAGRNAQPIDVDAEVAQALRASNVDVAFIALHGGGGENGEIQGLLETMRIPYTGSGVLASALGMDKEASARLFAHHGIPTPPSVFVTRKGAVPVLPFGFPVIVKPVSQGSSLGVTIVERADALEGAMTAAFGLDPRIMIQPYISGREVQVGILQEAPLGAIEIRSKTAFYDYEAKYLPGRSEHLFPAPLPPPVYQQVLALGLAAHQALGCSGVSRVDLMLDGAMNPSVLEVNTLPGMTETSLLPEMARHVGIDFDTLVLRILATAGLNKTTRETEHRNEKEG
jgi:D-alanine-D-alanine ligase